MMRRPAAYIVDSKRPAMKRAVKPMLGALVLFYLGFHTISGDRSVFALFSEKRRLAEMEAALAVVKSQREALDKKVQGLSSKSLDLDLLDEQARHVLGMAGKNEVVVFLGD